MFEKRRMPYQSYVFATVAVAVAVVVAVAVAVAVVDSKGDVTRDDSQRRFLAQQALQCSNNVTTIRNNVATML